MFTIQAHGIPVKDTAWGNLSEAQLQLLTDPSPIRVCGAPTGAGKTYAFIQAAKNGDLILFVVPTQALAKDIEESSRQEKILAFAWDGRQSASLRENGQDVWIVRKNQLDQLKQSGGMLITTPETLGMILLGKPQRERIPLSVVDLLQARHIVFDEAHTLSVRAFGFLHFWAVLAVWWNRMDPASRCVNLTLLSATHSNLFKAFSREDNEEESYLPAGSVSFFDEEIENGQKEGFRMLHGNVEVNIENGNILDCVEKHGKEVLEKNEHLLILYDSLRALAQDEWKLRGILTGIGVKPDECFMINGQDRKSNGHSLGGSGFEAGLLPMEKHRVIIATSCIEAGVNIKKLHYAILDPGLDAAALLQRIGRISRGDMDGKVWITTPKTLSTHWQRLNNFSGTITITHLAKQLSPLRDLPLERARRLGSAYWSMLSRHQPGLYKELTKAHQTMSEAKTPGRFLNSLWSLAESTKGLSNRDHYKTWLNGIDREITDLRGFSPSVLIKFADYPAIEYSYEWATANLKDPDEIDEEGMRFYREPRNKCMLENPRKIVASLLCPDGSNFAHEYYPGRYSQQIRKDYEDNIRRLAKYDTGNERTFMNLSADFVNCTGLLVREKMNDEPIL